MITKTLDEYSLHALYCLKDFEKWLGKVVTGSDLIGRAGYQRGFKSNQVHLLAVFEQALVVKMLVRTLMSQTQL